MSNKRPAVSELNADNWDDEVEEEEAGTFRVASETDLTKRVMKTAKRRSNLISSDEPKKGVFSNFAGFGKSPSTSAISPFAFLSNIENGKKEEEKKPKPEPVKVEDNKSKSLNHSDEYCANLKNLNLSVCEWIKSHIEKNPFCILTPIFDDYKKYLKEFDKFKSNDSQSNLKTNQKFTDLKEIKPSSVATTTMNMFSSSNSAQFSIAQNKLPESPKNDNKIDLNKTTNSPSNIFSQGFSSTPVSKAPLFSFQSTSATTTTTSGFSFGGAKPFSFGNVISEETKTVKAEEENDEDEEPPKVNFTPVVEEDSVFSKRCKVFVKNDGSFGDRGVGTLYLKAISGSEKYQLIVRADTSLGNLLINMVLSQSVPTKRMGKNNVMLVTIPTPEAKPPPVPILLRVKTSEEADALLETLDKYKK